MSDLTGPLTPAPDVREALRVDMQRLLTRDRDHPPPTIGQIAKGDDMFSSMAQRLIDVVGSSAQVEELHSRPHIDEAFDWSGIAEADRAKVKQLLDLISSDTPVARADGELSIFEHIGLDRMRPRLPWCDPEYRTIAWRVLRTLALDPVRPLDRRNKAERLAAAIVWISLTASGGFDRRRRLKPATLWDWFEVSSCKRIAGDLAGRVRQHNASVYGSDEVDLRPDQCAIGEITLGSSSLLHSTFRQSLLEQRDDLLDRVSRRQEDVRSAHPIIVNGLQDPVGFRSRPVTVRWAVRGECRDSGRACVSVALGEGLDDIEVLGLSIPDARRLIEALQHALDAPIAR